MSSHLVARDENTLAWDPLHSSDHHLTVASYFWDSDTLSWVKATVGTGSPSSDVNVLNFPASQTIDDGGLSITVDGSVSINGTVDTEEVKYTTNLDQASPTVMYIGNAVAGTSTASSSWRVKKLTFDVNGGFVMQWADGDTSFNNVWNNRASLSYS